MNETQENVPKQQFINALINQLMFDGCLKLILLKKIIRELLTYSV